MLAVLWLFATTVAAQTPVADVRTDILRADDARVTTPAQRKVIDDALTHAVPDVRMAALRAIGRTQRAEFLPKAIAELSNPSIDVRREAAFAVAHIGSGEPSAFVPAEKALREALGRETDMLVGAALAEEYGRLPFPAPVDVDAAAQTLRGLLTRLGGDGGVAPITELGAARGAEALARRAARPARSGNAPYPLLAGALADLLGSFYNAQRVAADKPQDIVRARTRRLALLGMLALDGVSADVARLAVADTDAQVRRLGVMAMSRQMSLTDGAFGERALPSSQAKGWLGDGAVIVRHAVASRIGPTRPEVAEAALADAHVHVRLAALDALGEAGACRAPCTSRLDRQDAFAAAAWHEGAHALVALARTDASAAQPHVTRAASAETWQVRMYAARAALYTRQADVIARLAADSNVNVRHAALVAWRGAKLPGLTAAAVAALGSDDGQLVLEAVAALESGNRQPATGNPGAATGNREPVTGNPGATDGNRRTATGSRGAATGDRAEVPRADIVAALRSALARLTTQKRETSRDPRAALIERIAELDAEREVTLRPYLSDFDPFVAARVATLLNVRHDGPFGERPLPSGGPSSVREGDGPRTNVPTMAEVERLAGTTVTLRLKGGRTLTLRLYAEQAPTAVARFVAQVRAGEWNGRTFHRVEPGFVVQGGSFAANEYAGAATFTRDEFSSLSHVRGTVGISTRGPDTGDGQIFINLVDNARLDFAYTVIGSIMGDASPIDDIVEGEVIEAATVSTLVATAGQSPAATSGAP